MNWIIGQPPLTGIVFNHDGTTWHAPLSAEYVCLGQVRALEDPNGVYGDLPTTAFSLVSSTERNDGSIAISGTVYNVNFHAPTGGAPPEVGYMIKDPQGLKVLQQVIAVHKSHFESGISFA